MSDPVWERLKAEVGRYRRTSPGVSGEVIDEEFVRATGAPDVGDLVSLSIRASVSMLPPGERTRDVVLLTANAWMMGAVAMGLAARDVEGVTPR